MDWVVFFGGIFAGQFEDYFGTAGVFCEEVGDLKGSARDVLVYHLEIKLTS